MTFEGLDVRQCFICSKTFDKKSDMMSHRKKTHLSIIQVCSKFQEGNCRFRREFCWYKHDVEDTEEDTPESSEDTVFEKDEYENDKEMDSDFQKVTKKSRPPSVNRSQNSN